MHLSILPSCVCAALSFLVPIEEKFTLLIYICLQRHILELRSFPVVSTYSILTFRIPGISVK